MPNWRPADYGMCDETFKTRVGTPFTVDGKREYTREWHVVVKRKEMGTNAACSHPSLPKPWALYQAADGQEFDELAVLVEYSATRQEGDDFYHWLVTAKYSTEVPEGGIPALTGLGADPKGSQNNPWDERPVVEWDWDETQETPPCDLDGRPFTNSANQPFVPAPTFPTARSVLVISRNEPKFDRTIAARYAYAVNSDTFLGANPGGAQCLPPRAKPMNRGRLQFYRISYRVRFNLPQQTPLAPITEAAAAILLPFTDDKESKDRVVLLQSWQPSILDQGTHRLQTIFGAPFNGRSIPITRNGHIVTQPVLLDGKGKEALPVTVGDTRVIIPSFRKFRRYHSMPFKPITDKGLFGGV